MNNKYLMAEGEFEFQFFIEKAIPSEESDELYVEGIASTMNVDHDSERMSLDALKAMVNVVNTKGVPLRIEHQKGDDEIIGIVNKAWIDERNQMKIKAQLDKTNTVAKLLHDSLKKGTKLGLSVGGAVRKAIKEISEKAGGIVKTFYDVVLKEISVTQRPANYDAWLFAKSYKEKDESDEAFYSVMPLMNEFLFENPQLDYLHSFAKSIPDKEWKKVGEEAIKSNTNLDMDLFKKKVAKEEESEETKEKEQSEENTEKEESTEEEAKKETTESEETKKEESSETEAEKEEGETMTERIDRLESTSKEIVKALEGITKMMKEAGRGGQENTSGNGDTDATREAKGGTTQKEETSASETDTEKEQSETSSETEKEESSSEYEMEAVKSINEFSKAIQSFSEKMEKGGKRVPGLTQALVDYLKADPEFQKSMAELMKLPGFKKSVSVGNVPYMLGKDGKRFALTANPIEEKVEKSENGKTFKEIYQSKFSTTKDLEE
jgi:chemotaxis protein histidine kinase CheA